MGWFTKEEKVPDIPPAPQLPDLPEEGERSRERKGIELPSLPHTAFIEKMNDDFVKSAVNDSEDSEEKEEIMEELPRDFHLKEEYKSKIPILPNKERQDLIKKVSKPEKNLARRTLEIHPSMHPEHKIQQIEPIFVRIDKFQKAQKNFNEIKKSIKEIESVLKKIDENRQKEDEEIRAWSENIEKIKARLSEVDSEIFNQV